MKKIPLIILSLTIGLASIGTRASNASAIYVDTKDNVWYTVPELLKYKEQYDREAEETCGNDSYCLEELYFSKMDSGGIKFQALEQLTQQQIIMTAINPGEETVKVLFFDEDMMMKHMGISEPLTLGEFYMGWFDHGSDRIFNYGIYSDDLFAETLPGAHMIYAQKDNLGDKIPANQEFEISVAGSNLTANASGVISYAAFADPYFNAMGYFGYTSCLMEPDYTEGVECRLMFSAEEGYRYFPPRETTFKDKLADSIEIPQAKDDEKEENDSVETEETNDETNPEEGSDELEAEKQDNILGQTEDTAELALINEELNNPPKIEIQQSIITQNIKSPNTGTLTAPCAQKTIEFPWWLAILIVLGNTVLLWLFWPKSPKNPKKVLDKKSRVR